jgi:hypothetical protein
MQVNSIFIFLGYSVSDPFVTLAALNFWSAQDADDQ